MMGIVSAIFAVAEIRVLTGKSSKIPTIIYVLKHMSTVGVVLTMVTTVIFLAPNCTYGYFAMFTNSNLFYHLVVPLLAVLTFVFFENTDTLKKKATLFGIIPMVIYSIVYTTNVLIHLDGGHISEVYDIYRFARSGISSLAIVLPVMLGLTYLISYLLWRCNKKLHKQK